MSLVNLVGSLEDLDETLLRCLRSGYFHPEMAIHTTEPSHGFRMLEGENPYAQPLGNLLKLSSDLKLKLIGSDARFEDLNLDSVKRYITSLEEKVADLAQRKRMIKESISQHEQALIQLRHLAGLNVSFDEIFACRYVKVRFGRLPCDSYSKLPFYDDRTFFFFDFDHDKEYYWGVYFAPVSNISIVDDIFTSLYFERMRVPDYAHGTPDVATANIKAVLANEKEELQRIRAELIQLHEEEKPRVLKVYSMLKFGQAVFDLHRYVATINKRFYLVGFIPKDQAKAFSVLFNDLQSVDCVAKPYDTDPSLAPPVKLRNNRFSAPFEQFVNMYSLPSYQDIDPTSFFAVTYTLLFGIMFGDLGQGLLLAVIGLVMAKWKKMNFGRIMARLGLSSMVFGTLYGSVFGFEELLDPVFHSIGIRFLPIKVFDNSMTNWLLVGAIAIGVALICISIGINIFVGFRAKDYQKAIFGNNGIAGLIFYLAAAFMVVNMMALHTDICNIWYILFLIVAPLLVIFFRGPLADMVSRRKTAPDQSVGEFIIENFFELFEYVLSYLSNSMSFLRVGGFILSHAGMMAVVMSLAGMVGEPTSFGGAVGYGLVVIIGNLFVMALEGLIVGIQCLRLEFYEMFSRNFEGNGKPFEPAAVSYGTDR